VHKGFPGLSRPWAVGYALGWVFVVLDEPGSVVRALLTYTDWWQPATTSILQVGRHGGLAGDGIRPGLLENLDERSELCRRMLLLADRDRQLLYLWYLKQLPAQDIARKLHISRRQCFRRRSAAVRALADPEGNRESDPPV
jgi:DNA-directed RNA polymerase specialized sigma24 family protein